MEAFNGLRAQPVGRLCHQSFWTAVLLTGSLSKAEKAVTEGIHSLKDSGSWGEDLLQGTVTAAFQDRHNRRQAPEDLANAVELLPPELGRVLRLPSLVRHCFVLRTLMGLPVSGCARLLALDEDTVNRNAYRAVLMLAPIARNEAAETIWG